MNISVLGDGGWGTTLAILLHKRGHRVTLWGAFPQYVSYLNKKRINSKFLPGVVIPRGISITADLKQAVDSRELIVLAVPAQYMRSIVKRIKGYRISASVFLSAAKGLEINKLKQMSEVAREELGKIKLAVLSGPTIAYEVARGIPTTAVIASQSSQLRKNLADVFSSSSFRIYTSSDVTGVELGGSLKNIIAIACGISDGLGFGANTKAALLSRGLAEISRLGRKMGAKGSTFSGISGLGDLVTTCISPFSRNRCLGEQIGKGRRLKLVINKTKMVVEGVATAKAAYRLAYKYRIDMPITKQVYAVLYKNKNPGKAVRDLMTRSLKEE
ncbi:MAG: NAD(P)-dependent glycerol-3-phosphate dehydrogenase [Candidatus Omnitrophica bacterium]|nr:NAD(P)-dependent glycerol-3-phosphate dehydrogenase [Candidatus Omnitrophota bacterium]MBU1871314.1 NAD(P)-dependent glycerol-3-phosphate dehydrogenase [Candidatus Omnitrophota bacterium]